jgi:hypothetical protein
VDGQIVEVGTVTANDGALIGKHKVQIQAVAGDGTDMYAKRVSLISDRYGDPEKSGLTADVPAGGASLTFELKK